MTAPDLGETETPRRSRLDFAAWFILFAALAAAYVSQAALFHRYINDDAYITLRYSRSWAMGHGPYFNPGEHVEGYTNFLLMLLLTPVIRFGGADAALPTAKLIGLLCGAAAIAVTFAIARRLASEDEVLASRPEPPAFLAAGVVAVNPAYAVNAMSGLETLLYGAALTIGVWLDLSVARDGRWRGAGFAFAAAALTRPEGAFIFAVYWSSAFLVRRLRFASTAETRPSLHPADVLVVAMAVGAQLAFRAAYYDGDVLPNTFFAKTAGFGGYDPLDYVRDGLWCGFLGLSGVAIALAGWCLRGGGRLLAVPAAAAAAVGVLLPLVVGSDWMLGWRLLVPYVPLLSCLVCVGWAKAVLPALRRRAAWAAPVVLGVLPLLWVVQEPARSRFFDTITADADDWPSSYGAVVDMLCAGGSRQAIAMTDIGKVGYSCFDRRIIDITGLTDRFIARSPGTFLDKDFDAGYVVRQDPQYVIMRLIERPDAADQSRMIVAPYTAIEDRLYRDPAFVRTYRPGRTSLTGSESGEQRLLAILRAERVIPHWGPDGHGYLVVFRRNDAYAD